MEKLKPRLYYLVLIFAVLSVSFALLNTPRQRDFYYAAIYLGILGLIFEREKLNFKKFNIAYPIIIFGIVKLVYFFALERSPDGYNVYSDQLSGGKKLVLGGILVFYMTQCSDYLRNINYKNLLLLVVGLGFVTASCYAGWQAIHGFERVEMGLDRSTNTAYIYSAFSLFLIYLLYAQKKPLFYIIAALAIITSFIVAILTGTRAVIISHLLIVAVMSFYHFNKIHLKSMLIVLTISAIAIFSLYKDYIKPKINQTLQEVTLYEKGKDNTSLGARFSMWTVGLANFSNAPFGQSMNSRQEYTSQYTSKNPKYKTAMQFVNIHLHDEMIETLSLQGIVGGLSLLWFYLSISWVALREKNTPLLFTMNALILYGLSDVLLLSSEAILFFITLIGICGIKAPPERM